MAALDIKLLKDTTDLIRYYNTNLRFKAEFDKLLRVRGTSFRRRPLKLYVKIITLFAPEYKSYNQQIKSDKEKVKELFERVYKDRGGQTFTNFERAQQAELFTPEEKVIVEEIEQVKSEQEKVKKYEDFVDKREVAQQPQESQLPTKPLRDLNFRQPRAPQAVRITVQPQVSKIPGMQTVRIPGIPGGPGRGLGLRSIGGAGRGAAPLARAGLGLGGNLARAGIGAGARAAAVGLFTTPVGWIIIGIVIVLLLLLILFFLPGLKLDERTALFPPFDQSIDGGGPPACVPGGSTGPSRGAGGCPTLAQIEANKKSTPETCQYFDPSVPVLTKVYDKDKYPYGDLSQQQIESFINQFKGESSLSETEFRRRTNYIINKSREAGINPIISLGYWRTESGFGDGLGCIFAGESFEEQVACAVGLSGTKGAAQCARGVAGACEFAVNNRKDTTKKYPTPRELEDKNVTNWQGIPANTYSNADIYKDGPTITTPIRTLDDFAEIHGPKSPLLRFASPLSEINNNCPSTYNKLLEVVVKTNACDASKKPILDTPTGGTGIATCKFYRNDQTGRNFDPNKPLENACPTDESFRCEKALTYKSPALIKMFEEVSQLTGIPASVLAGLVRVEATTNPAYSATKQLYSISDYTDSDITEMTSTTNVINDIDATIGTTPKALCPRSITGAIGITQIQPPKRIHDQIRQVVDSNNKSLNRNFVVPPTFESVGGYDERSLKKGLKFLSDYLKTNKTIDDVTIEDFCDPKKSLIMGAGFILGKLGVEKWDPPKDDVGYQQYINRVAKLYYGADGLTGTYGGSLWDSVNNCKAGSGGTNPPVCTPSGGTGDASCPIPEGKISCGSYDGVTGKVVPCHCAADYPPRLEGKLCQVLTSGGNLVRTAKAIDVMPKGRNGREGDTVVLPTIKGQTLSWKYLGSQTDTQGFGGLRLFQSEPTPEGIWSLYFIHVDTKLPSLSNASNYPYKSGQEVAQIGSGENHVHVNIGLNVQRFGEEADKFDPGWKFPDKDLNMCVP